MTLGKFFFYLITVRLCDGSQSSNLTRREQSGQNLKYFKSDIFWSIVGKSTLLITMIMFKSI